MRVLIVDDEAPARRRLRRMLEKIVDVVVVGEAADGLEAQELAAELEPELVLLDIQMPELDGLAAAADGRLGRVVFVTAYNEHAVAAFELDAVDYLLKPVSQARLEQAVAKARRAATPSVDLGAVLERALGRPSPSTVRLSARSGSTIHVFEARNITRLSATDKYTVFRADGIEYVLDETLVQLEARLTELEFVRVHRGELVNLAAVVAVHTDPGQARVELRDGQFAPVSRRHLAELKRRLGQ